MANLTNKDKYVTPLPADKQIEFAAHAAYKMFRMMEKVVNEGDVKLEEWMSQEEKELVL